MDLFEDSQVMDDLVRLFDSTGELRLILDQLDNTPSQVIQPYVFLKRPIILDMIKVDVKLKIGTHRPPNFRCPFT